MIILSGVLQRWEHKHAVNERQKVSYCQRTVDSELHCAKKVVSDSPGLVDFAIRLMSFLNLVDGQELFSGEIQITEA